MFEKKITYLEELPPLIFDDIGGDNSYTYAQVDNFKAIYFVTNVFDFAGNRIGDSRYDSKLISLPGGFTITLTTVTKTKSDCGCHDIYIYLAGTRSYQIMSGGEIVLANENTTVQNVVVGNKTYNSGNYDAKIDPKSGKLLVTVTYK
jgi:hypothetical protein